VQHRRDFRAILRQRIDALTAAIFEGGGGMLLPLTPPLAGRLGIQALLPRQKPAAASREADTIGAGERVVRLVLVDDPTAALPPPETAAPARTPSLKTAIPERFIGPWPFIVSREQAVCDLNRDRARSRLDRMLDRLRRETVSGRDRRRWQRALEGKSLDDQVWAVPPPRHGLSDAAVHAWARRTLEAGGYEAATMLLEWEIFWRRRGL